MKKVLIFLFTSLLLGNVNAQQWDGSTTTTGDIYRTGDVGIGTTTPVSKLELGSDQWLKFQASSTAGILFREGTHAHTATNVRYGAKMYYDEDDDILRISTMQDYTENVGICLRRTYPRVGIGNYTEDSHIASPLNIKGTSNNAQLEIGNSTTYDGNYIMSYDRVASTYKNLVLRTQSTPTMTLLTNGNVGIGDSSPWARLHLEGNGTQPALYLDGVTRDISYMGNLQIGYWNGTTWTEKMIILSNGNVGIGCTNPQVKLAVNGKIKASEMEITTGPCSDFVFEPDYNLMDLNTLEEYVTNNKHLPKVPSAKEFAENGYSVGEMDDMLLRKIEELTLYIIKQQKEIAELKSKLK